MHRGRRESPTCIEEALTNDQKKWGNRILLVIHLDGYYRFSGEPGPKYYTVNVLVTGPVLDALETFDVEPFAFATTCIKKVLCSMGPLP